MLFQRNPPPPSWVGVPWSPWIIITGWDSLSSNILSTVSIIFLLIYWTWFTYPDLSFHEAAPIDRNSGLID